MRGRRRPTCVTRRELVAAIQASDSGQNTQVRAGFVPGKDAAIPGRR